jgi:hypothetical protein
VNSTARHTRKTRGEITISQGSKREKWRARVRGCLIWLARAAGRRCLITLRKFHVSASCIMRLINSFINYWRGKLRSLPREIRGGWCDKSWPGHADKPSSKFLTSRWRRRLSGLEFSQRWRLGPRAILCRRPPHWTVSMIGTVRPLIFF